MLDRVVAPDGSMILAVKEENSFGGRILMLRYRTNGTLIYARELSFGANPKPVRGFLAVHPDASVSFLGDYSVGFDRKSDWQFARVSANGAILAARTYAATGGVLSGLIAPLENGASAVFYIVGNNLQFSRVSANGFIEAQATFADNNYAALSNLVRLNNGDFVVTARLNNGVRARVINPVTGASPSVYFNGDSSSILVDKDATGNPVLAHNGSGGLVLGRRSASNIASLLNSRTFPASIYLVDLVVSPNGNTVVATQETGDDLIRWLGPGAFPNVASAFIASTVTVPQDLSVGPDNVAYFTGDEVVNGVNNVYLARYLATGVRSAQRRIAGSANWIDAGSGIWVTGHVSTRRRGTGPFVARYSR